MTEDLIRRSWVRFPPRSKIFSLPRVVPCFPLLGLTPSGLFMGLSSTIIYTSELILWFHYLYSQCHAAQHSYVPMLKMVNRPFARSDHMVQNHTYWEQVPKQRQVKVAGTSCFVFQVPQCNLRPACVILYHLTISCKGSFLPLVKPSAFFVSRQAKQYLNTDSLQ